MADNIEEAYEQQKRLVLTPMSHKWKTYYRNRAYRKIADLMLASYHQKNAVDVLKIVERQFPGIEEDFRKAFSLYDRELD